MKKASSGRVVDAAQRMSKTVRTVDFTGVPRFMNALKSWVPRNCLAASCMAAGSVLPGCQTKCLLWGRT